MNIFQQLTKVFDRTSGADEYAKEIAQIHNELKDVRMSIRFLEMAWNANSTESYAQELNAKREREHELIKEAKQLCGEHIRIPYSLREHREETCGTNVPVVE